MTRTPKIDRTITSQTADCVCLKRPPPARVPCPRATPALQLATLQASGRVARVPKRCAVTHASVVQESMPPPIVGRRPSGSVVTARLQGTRTTRQRALNTGLNLAPPSCGLTVICEVHPPYEPAT